MEKMKMESINITEKNIDKIAELFPNCITETVDEKGKPKKAINFEILKQMLSDEVIDGDEAYEFTWVGKKAAIVEANKPIRKTLRPCKEESVNWDKTENLYIEGDNLEVLKLLQESYLGKVKMIYIDPPYNTGNDFIYNDDFKMTSKEYSDETGELDDEGNRMFKNTNSNGRFHSDWCSMIYSRLILARNLLSDDGVIFISIDDNEQENLKKICDEIFGRESHISTICVELSKTQGMKVASAQKGKIVKNHEYVFVYQKNSSVDVNRMPLYDKSESWDTHFNCIIKKEGNDFKKYNLGDYLKQNYPSIFEKFKRYGFTKNSTIDAKAIGKAIEIDNEIRRFFYHEISKDIYQEMACSINVDIETKDKLEKGEIVKLDKYLLTMSSGGKIRQYRNLHENLNITDEYFSDLSRTTIRGALWKGFYSDMMNVAKEGNIDFKNGKKPIRLMKQLFKWANCKDDIILDFFSGSATTAHAVMQLNADDGGNRKFIMVQLPEKTDEKSEAYKAGYKNICEIGKERIRRAGKKIKEENPLATQDLDIGFRVFKLDDSNMNDVYYNTNEYSQNLLDMMESNIKSDRTDMDLLFGCLLEWGLPLSLPYSSENIEGYTVHNYNDGDLIACFEKNIPESVIKEIAKKQPLRAVFRDSSFVNSPSKINVSEIFKLMAPNTRVKVI